MTYELVREQLVPRPVGDVFEFFSQARNLERITPPWLRFGLLGDPGPLGKGSLIEYRLHVHGVPLRWVSRIEEWESERAFVDRQLRGPYRFWHHRHEFIACGEATVVRDRIRYVLPFGRLGHPFVRRDLDRIFDFRRDAVERLLA
jgi:ligand-binding SRPBCC domain-containing protein